MRTKNYVIGIGCVLVWGASVAQVPVTFEPGTPARASEVNENFEDLDLRLNGSFGSLIVSQVSASEEGVASAQCPSERLVASASCDCSNEQGTRNFGVLFGCSVAGNGGLAGCFSDAATFDPQLPSPLATVTLVCLSGTANDGTPLQPTSVVLDGSSTAQKSMSADTATDADHVEELEAATELGVALKSARDQFADHAIRLQAR